MRRKITSKLAVEKQLWGNKFPEWELTNDTWRNQCFVSLKWILNQNWNYRVCKEKLGKYDHWNICLLKAFLPGESTYVLGASPLWPCIFGCLWWLHSLHFVRNHLTIQCFFADTHKLSICFENHYYINHPSLCSALSKFLSTW